MLPNIVNTLFGLFLVYAAVLNPALLSERRYLTIGGGIVILILAGLAMRTDHHPWQNTVNMLMGLLLTVLGILPLATYPVVTFWGVFWVGTVVAVLALWAALYRPALGEPVK